jgi:hypothetical protein
MSDTVKDATDASELAPPAKNPAAVALGKLGGAKGGAARAAKLTPEQRQAIASLGGQAARGVPRKRTQNK